MKTFNRFSIVLLIFSLVLLTSCGKKDSPSTDSKSSDTKTSSDSKSESSGNKEVTAAGDFTIKYELSGKVKGDVTTYKKGKRVKQEMTMDVKGAKMTTNNYYDDNFVYTVMDIMGKKVGTKIDISKYKSEGANEGKDLDYRDMENYLKDKKKVGTETILGKECDIYETGKGVKISVTKQYIPLKIQTEPMTMLAVSFDNKVNISDEAMEVPKDVNFSDMGGMMKNLKK
ncbi:MAG: hypothetical protein JSS63_01700 [Bacteroidetes bacterium]|nr:hypothetical protein [Bacteroidota bacterium]